MNTQDIKTTLKTFILDEYLPGEDPTALTDSTPLMTTGIRSYGAQGCYFLENQSGSLSNHTKWWPKKPQYLVGYRAICEVKASFNWRYCAAAVLISRFNIERI
jgi:hypothetical protein